MRSLVVAVSVLLGALVFESAALAAAPEIPETKPATGITGTTATFNGTLNLKKTGEAGEKYKFFYKESATECRGEGEKEEPEFALPSAGAQAEAVSLSVSNLKPKTTYTYCVWVRNEEFETAIGAPQTFETPAGAPVIGTVEVMSLNSSEVTLAGVISPGGDLTTYKIEYEPGKLTSKQSLPAAKTPVPFSEKIIGLQPDTEYHARLLVHNEAGDTEATVTFKTSLPPSGKGSGSSGCPNSTFSGFNPALPDCRAAELVTSANEIGEAYDPGGSNGHEEDTTTLRPFRSATTGSAVAYLADPGPGPGGDGSSAKGKGNEYLATRGSESGPNGWGTTNITPPVGFGESASREREYEAFSPDLSVGIVTSEQLLLAAKPSPQGPSGCAVLYSRNSGAGIGGEYHALFTETQTPRNCGGTQASGNPAGRDGELLFAGETADHSQKLFQTPAALIAPATEAEGFGGNLYDSAGGRLSLVNVLPGGGLDPSATFGGPSGLLRNAPDFSHTISANGSRVFWSAVESSEKSIGSEKIALQVALYARENPISPSATTIQLDATQKGATGASGGAQFWTASSDGSRVFFTDCSRLTEGSTASSGEGCEHGTESELVRTGNDLYVYDFNRPAGERLVDLTVDHNGGDPLGANVQGVIGASEDGSYVYFVAGGALESEPNSHNEAPSTQGCQEGGGCNLYEMRSNGGGWGKPQFIATLAEKDNNLSFEKLNDPLSGRGTRAGDWIPDLGSRTAEVSPDGRHLVFESTRQLESSRQLTGYDNSNVASDNGGEGATEIFLYNADKNSLSCASCNPTGAPPTASIQANGTGIGYAPYLPVSSSNTFMHRWMSSTGTEVFFNTSQPLVQGDSNGTQDVYEWEAEGTAGCPRATSIYGGCVFLLSGGESTDYSFLVDTDESGENVYLTHRGQLDGVGPQGDKNHLYDVRVEGGFPETSLACTGTGCQGVPPAAPSFATPASATFSGAGNLAPARSKVIVRSQTRAQKFAKALQVCEKDKRRRKRLACEKQARHRYGPVRSRSGKRSARQGGRKS